MVSTEFQCVVSLLFNHCFAPYINRAFRAIIKTPHGALNLSAEPKTSPPTLPTQVIYRSLTGMIIAVRCCKNISNESLRDVFHHVDDLSPHHGITAVLVVGDKDQQPLKMMLTQHL